MFDYFGMSYKDSVDTIAIAIVCWHKCMNFGAETCLGGGVMSPFVFPSTALVQAPHFDVHWQEGPTKILATLP